MLSPFSRFLLTATVFAPSLFSLGLIGLVKYNTAYWTAWKHLLSCLPVVPTEFCWYAITISFLYFIICLILLKIFLSRTSSKIKDSKSITPKSYNIIGEIGMDQQLSTIIPWLSLFLNNVDFKLLFVCLFIQCMFIAIVSYNNSNYNLLCSILGYRYYEVKTDENTFILLSKKCIKNKSQISDYVDITDYMGVIIDKSK